METSHPKKTVSVHEALTTLEAWGLPHPGLEQLHECGVTIRRDTLGGSHSVVTYPPLDALEPIGNQPVGQALHFGKTVHLYVHIAFCETQCSFCHYAVKHYRGESHATPSKRAMVERYLAALHHEIRGYADRLRAAGTRIASIYIGGGTPLVLTGRELAELLALIRKECSVLPKASICVEGSPLTIVEEPSKLELLRSLGVTRFSFGVQSFNDEVLLRAARGYKRDTAIQACELVAKIFPHWNIDLIQSLFKGGIDEVWENLQTIARLRPPHLTWYHGRFADRPQGVWRRDPGRQTGFENEQATLVGRALIWQELERMGYRMIDGNRFALERRFADPFKEVRTSVTTDLLGIGASAYSHVGHLFFRNDPAIIPYVERVERGESAMNLWMALTSEEQLAASYVIGLRRGRYPSDDLHRLEDVEPRLVQKYHQLCEALQRLGLLERCNEKKVRGGGLRLSRKGRLFEDEILALFYSPSVQAKLKAPQAHLPLLP